MRLTAVSLFSGIGGFEIALEANGFEILCQVEIDERCRRFLHGHWPNIPQYGDIREFPAELYRGATIVVGGPPCQPISCAGKRRGEKDDRWLWGETIAVIETIRPTWCLLENPAAIRTMGLDGILSKLESIGYSTGTVGIPACAVNSPQLRNRYWIVAHNKRIGQFPTISASRTSECLVGESVTADESQGDLADTESQLPEWAEPERDRREKSEMPARNGNFWGNSIWLPCADGKLRRAPDDSFGVAHGLHRSILAGLGNSIVPQVAAEIIKAIKETM